MKTSFVTNIHPKTSQTAPLSAAHSDLYALPNACQVLIIDHEAESARKISAMLNSYGYSTTSLTSPKQALAQLFSTQRGAATVQLPDLIICDLLDDEMDGLDFLRDIRRPGFPHLPVIIVTSLESNSTFEKAVIEMGADDFVIKPVRSSELLLRVRVLLRGLPGVAAWPAPELI